MKVFIFRDKQEAYQVYVQANNATVSGVEVHSSYEDALTAAKYLSVQHRAPICDCSEKLE